MFTMSSHGNLTGKLGGMTNYENQQGGTKSRMGRCLPAHHTMFLTAQKKEHRLQHWTAVSTAALGEDLAGGSIPCTYTLVVVPPMPWRMPPGGVMDPGICMALNAVVLYPNLLCQTARYKTSVAMTSLGRQ
jgi:hypothetical protein